MNARMIAVMLAVLLGGCGLAGEGSIFNTDPATDVGTNGQVLETPKNWKTWTEDTDISVDAERRNLPTGGITWNARWLPVIDYTRKHYDNPQKYIDYIITARRQAGLPELVE